MDIQKVLIISVLILVYLGTITVIGDPKNLRTAKKRYAKFRKLCSELPEDHKFRILEDPILISGYYGMHSGLLGYNTNKGTEIGICVDGCPNEIMHVLLHELAHTTVEEYDHSKKFWNNLRELKKMASDHKLYKHIEDPTGFCGSKIHD